MNRSGESTLTIQAGDDLHISNQQQQQHQENNHQPILNGQNSFQESPVDWDIPQSSTLLGSSSAIHPFIDTSRSLSSQRSHVQYIATDSCEQYHQNGDNFCTGKLLRRIRTLEIQVRTGFIITCSLLAMIAIGCLVFMIHNTTSAQHHTAVYKEKASIIQATSSRQTEDKTNNNATPGSDYRLCQQMSNHYWSEELRKCYIFHHEPKFFGDAEKVCNSHNQMMAYPENEKEVQILHHLAKENTSNDSSIDLFIGFERYQNAFLSIDKRVLLSTLGFSVQNYNSTDNSGQYCQISKSGSVEIVGEKRNRYFCTFKTDSISTRLVLVSISKSLRVL